MNNLNTEDYSRDYVYLYMCKSYPEKFNFYFTKFYKEYQNYIYKKAKQYHNYFKGYIDYSDIVSDLTLEFYYAINWLKLDRIQDKKKFYIYSTLDYRYDLYFKTNCTKKNKFQKISYTDNPIEVLDERKNTPEKIYYAIIDKIQDKLTNRAKLICKFYYIDKYSYSEISKQLGITIAGVSWHVVRIKNVIRTEIKKNV